jgi:GTP-binding protein
MFFDHAKIHVAAGNGGRGSVSFRREMHVPRGGPDGGDGGDGGDVVLFVDPQVRDLQLFTYKVHFKAGAGQAGMGARKHGSNGETVRIPVPLGTQVWIEPEAGEDGQEPAESGEQAQGATLLADLVHQGQELVVARGGAGGRGNTRFTNSIHQAPKFAELGEEGEGSWIRLSLKLMADAGLAGLPNAGKSSLLRRVSNAKPKVAAYPFTTVEPMLGVVDWSGDGDVFTLADVPGLLEGASEGVGLGHEFLAHLERCFLMVHVVDITASSGLEPLDGFRVILHELEAHAGGLAEKPQVVVLNKIDAVTPEEVEAQREVFTAEVERLRRAGHPAFTYVVGEDGELAEQMVWPVSASTGAGLKDMVHWIGPLLRELGAGAGAHAATDGNDLGRDASSGEKVAVELGAPEGMAAGVDTPWDELGAAGGGGHVLYRPTGTSERAFVVRKVKKGFVVKGEAVHRLVRRFDLDNEEATRYVAEKFERLGVYAALRAQGAQPGDEVDVEGYAFEFN